MAAGFSGGGTSLGAPRIHIDQRALELDSLRDRARNPEEHSKLLLGPFGQGFLRLVLENQREQILTGNRMGSSVQPLLVVPITAAGLQGEQPLADRTM